jgi:hypothetical protein
VQRLEILGDILPLRGITAEPLLVEVVAVVAGAVVQAVLGEMQPQEVVMKEVATEELLQLILLAGLQLHTQGVEAGPLLVQQQMLIVLVLVEERLLLLTKAVEQMEPQPQELQVRAPQIQAAVERQAETQMVMREVIQEDLVVQVL